MRAWFIVSVVLVPFAALIACGDSSPEPFASAIDGSTATTDSGHEGASPSDGSVDTPKDIGTKFCARTIGATISATEACCNPAEKEIREYKTLIEAAKYLNTACGTSLDGSIGSGRVGYDSVAAEACFAAFDAAFDNDVCQQDRLSALELMRAIPCRDAFVGKQAIGEPCAVPYECQNGLACVASGEDEGTCQSPPAVGKPCGSPQNNVLNLRFGSHRSCALGSHCDPGIAACAAPTSGECDFDADCADGKLCILDQCSPRGSVGDNCESPAQCNSGLFCDIVVGTSAGKCAVKKAAGAPCAQGFSECKGICPETDAAASCEAFCGSE